LETPKHIVGVQNGWNLMSANYQSESDISVDEVHYAPLSYGENSLNLLDDVTNKNFVELGSGGSQNAIVLAKLGAKVTAVDFSPSQLSHAVSESVKQKTAIDFLQADIQNLTYFRDNAFDGIISVFALEFIEHLDVFFSECNRILKKKGQLILSTTHPLGAFEWDADTNTLNVTDYFNPPVEIWKEDDQEYFGVTYFRTVEELFTNVVDNGFTVKVLLEPKPLEFDKEHLSPYKGNYWTEFRDRLNSVPFAVVIKALKQ
jgi:ubiquinone/menaquinone biosynthesis C-methylase UbiE